jgi:hypothetical protein
MTRLSPISPIYYSRTFYSKTFPVLSLVFLTIALSGCLSMLGPSDGGEDEAGAELVFGDVETFRDAFEEMQKIDARYNTSFRKERLGAFVVLVEDIPKMQKDLFRLAEHVAGRKDIDFEAVSKRKGKAETDLALTFIAARIEMLESERYFQLGYKDGNAGLVGDGFFCSERPLILESLENFNQSIRHGINATYYIDVTLTQTKEVTHALIGVDEEKPEFYKAPFQQMGRQLAKNADLVARSCADQGAKDTYVVIDDGDGPEAG